MLTRTQKEQLVAELADVFRAKPAIFVADYTGVATTDMNALRKELKQHSRFRVVKKTLLVRALELADAPRELAALPGQIALAYGFDDAVAIAKTLAAFSKEHETFQVLGGVLDGQILDAQNLARLALVPPRAILLAQFVGVLAAPLRNFLFALSGPQRGLVTVLNRKAEA